MRDPILASWHRSQDFSVAADKLEMRYSDDLPLDTPLVRSAAPVLRSLKERLGGQAVSVILTDPTGLVLSRLTDDVVLEKHLDQVLLAPGFSYAEKYVGTNGIGTALEVGGPAHVFGHEHYAEHLEDLACAGVPIHHPVSGRLLGAVDLTCWRKDAGALLLTLARTTAEQIREALLADAGAGQLRLLREYMRACGRGNEVVFALNDDVVMLNEYARLLLSPDDQATLLARASDARGARTHLVDLPSGGSARLYCRAVRDGDRAAGVVAHVKLTRNGAGETPSHGPTVRVRAALPGLVGTGQSWLHASEELERIFRSGEWLAVEGEAGVGKLAMLRAVQLRRQPVGRFAVLDAEDVATVRDWSAEAHRVLTRDADVVVLRHVDRLPVPVLRRLTTTLTEARRTGGERRLWVAATLGQGPREPALHQLLQAFPSSLTVPPLRQHIDDLALLVPVFLARLGHANLSCSPAATRLLMRMPWPGNVAQLHETLREVVSHRRTGTISPEDLPAEVHAVSRRVLSVMESLERDAIVHSLTEAHGNKVQAARSLGLSRATIYRKIHDYGIVFPEG